MNDRIVAEGRAAQIFEHAPGLVCKRARAGWSLAYEANCMELVRAFGVPVPKVHEVLDGGTAIVTDKVEGPTMLQWFERAPWRLDAAARILGELADAVHDVIAPSWVHDAGDGGDRVLHLDLHPLNVIMSERGPMLIDWANTGRGAPATDDALTVVLLSSGDPGPAALARRVVVGGFRSLFVKGYLAHRDAPAVRSALPHAAALRICDPSVTPGEAAAIERLRTRTP